MVSVTCLAPTKSYSCSSACSLGTLDLQSSNNDPSIQADDRCCRYWFGSITTVAAAVLIVQPLLRAL